MRCSRCAGRGSIPLSSMRRRPCPRCDGDGVVCEGLDRDGDPCGRPVAARIDGVELCTMHAARESTSARRPLRGVA